MSEWIWVSFYQSKFIILTDKIQKVKDFWPDDFTTEMSLPDTLY